MDLVEKSAEVKRSREKSDFSVSSIIGLKDSLKRTSTDERDSIGSSVGSESGESTSIEPNVTSPTTIKQHNRMDNSPSPSLRNTDKISYSPGVLAEEDANSNLSDDEAGMSSGDSGLLKDINENLQNGKRDNSFEDRKENKLGNKDTALKEQTNNHSGKYINEGENSYYNNKGSDQQSDLSALQKLYSLESMQRFTESSAVFPGRETYPSLPNYDKPLMIDVGPGRSFTGSTRMPSAVDTSREGDKVKKKAVVREAVDPAKYVRIQDLEGIKFACSKCGNTYKWRKSLNKHWKEKHDGEIPTPHGQSLITLNIPQVKGKTTNINTALFSYAPLGSLPQRPTAAFPGTNMPTIPDKMKEKDPVYPSAEMLSKYEELSKQWMTFANAAAAATNNSNFQNNSDGKFSEKNDEVHKNKRVKSPERKITQPPVKSSTPNLALPRSRSETPRSTPSSVDMSFAAAAAAVAQNSFMMAAPPPAHSQSYRTVVQEECDDVAPLDLSKGSKPNTESANKCRNYNLASDDAKKPKYDKALDFSSKRSSSPPVIRDNDPNYSYKKLSSALRCVVCSHTFNSFSDLNQHFAIFHIDVIYEKTFSYDTESGRKDGTFSCIICGATYLYQEEIVQHFDKNHPALPNPYKKRANPGDLLADYQQEPSAKKAKENLHCIQCGFLAKDRGELNRHHLVHSLNRPYACTRCGYSTKHQDELKKHMRKYHTVDELYAVKELQAKITPDTEVLVDKPQEINISPENTACFSLMSKRRGSFTNLSKLEDGSPEVITVSPDSGFDTPESEGSKRLITGFKRSPGSSNSAEILLPYKCTVCEYRARWPSEITQHMKNHSDEKPFHCPRCTYKSKWKWDVVKHLKRCGGGTVKDVIDTTKQSSGGSSKGPSWVKALQFKDTSVTPPPAGSKLSSGPPNVTVLPSGVMKPTNPSPSGGERILTQSPPSPITPENHHLAPYNRTDQTLAATGPGLKGLNNGLYHCLHCPFVGNSPAELKRHTRVHSDEKPFSCLTCGYSSKWKCDLKKHLRTYNHESAVNLEGKSESTEFYSSDEQIQSPNDAQIFNYADQGIDNLFGMSNVESPSKQLYKCDKCQYVTYKKNFLDSHIKIHGQPGQSKLSLGSNKLKCKQCDFEAVDLPSFLQHKLTHNNVQANSPSKLEEEEQISPSSSSYTDEVDVMGSPTKHRRKPVKQFRCTKCPYTCFKRSGLEQHQSMHEPRGPGSLTCKYCDYNVYSRSLLGQHMKLHPEYLQEGECSDDESIPLDEHEGGADVGAIKNSSVFPGQTEEERRYSCEWCDVTYISLNELYQHAKSSHPVEYEQQEAAYSSMDSSAEDNGLLSPVPCNTNNSINVSEENLIDKETEFKKHKTNVKASPLNGKRKRKLLTCSDCGYTTDNSANLARHAIKHGQNATYQCEYCNYSLNRQGLVIAHMKQVHGVTVSSLSKREDKAIEKDDPISQNEPDTTEKRRGSVDGSGEVELVSIKGEMILMGQMGNRKSYRCPKCAYTTSNSSHCVNHMKQHGSNKRYNCEFCDYSLDKLPHIVLHMKSAHPDQTKGGYQDLPQQKVEPLVLNLNRLDNGTPKRNRRIKRNLSALILRNAIKKNGQFKQKVPRMKMKAAKKALGRVLKNEAIKKNGALNIKNMKRLSCNFCPYHTHNTGLLQNHLLQHNMSESS